MLENNNTKSPNIRINKVYTRTGDAGKTRLVGGTECYKDDMRVEVYGTVDELIASIGVCIELLKETNNNNFDSLVKILLSVQNQLFDLGTQIASPCSSKKEKLPHLSENVVSRLESEIDDVNTLLSDLTSFVLPGGSIVNAYFHIARTICRRAERKLVTLSKKEKIDLINLKYLNRLSDALFVWSRWVNIEIGATENLWKPNY